MSETPEAGALKVYYDITILNNRIRSGIYRYIVELLRALKKTGEPIEIACGMVSSSRSEAAACEIRLKRRLPFLFDHPFVNRAYSPFSEPLLDRAIAITAFDPRTRAFYNKMVAFKKKTAELWSGYRSLKADVYHDAVGITAITPLTKTPKVTTLFDTIPLAYPAFTVEAMRPFAELNLRRLVAEHGPVICISRWVRRDIVSRGVSPSRCCVIPLGVSDFFEPIAESKIGATLRRLGLDHRRYLLTVCTIEPRKNLLALLQVHAEMVKDGSARDWPLVLVGSPGWGGIHEKLLAGIRSTNGKVVITGRVNETDLRALYSGAGMFIYVPFVEGFGLPPLEAMRCGTPVIASDCTSLPEVVGNAALKVSPYDKVAIRRAILNLMRNRAQADELRARGRERALTFTWQKTAEMTLEVYRSAVKTKRKTRKRQP